jgi:hypothetical protein
MEALTRANDNEKIGKVGKFFKMPAAPFFSEKWEIAPIDHFSALTLERRSEMDRRLQVL